MPWPSSLREPAGDFRVKQAPGRSALRRVSMHLPERVCDAPQCLELVQINMPPQQQTILQVNAFQDGAWITQASVPTRLLETHTVHKILYTGARFYMTTRKDIAVLDTVVASVSFMDYPDEEIDHLYGGQLLKVDGDDHGVYLVNVVNGQELHIWMNRKVSGGGMSGWLLVDSICLAGIFAGLGMPHMLYRVACVGDNAAFVLLETENGDRFHFHIPSTTVELVFEAPPSRSTCCKPKNVWPFMMLWPPSFPALKLKNKEGHDQEA